MLLTELKIFTFFDLKHNEKTINKYVARKLIGVIAAGIKSWFS